MLGEVAAEVVITAKDLMLEKPTANFPLSYYIQRTTPLPGSSCPSQTDVLLAIETWTPVAFISNEKDNRKAKF